MTKPKKVMYSDVFLNKIKKTISENKINSMLYVSKKVIIIQESINKMQRFEGELNKYSFYFFIKKHICYRGFGFINKFRPSSNFYIKFLT